MAFNNRMNKKTDRIHHSSKSDRQHSFGGSHGASSADRTEDHRKDDRYGNKEGNKYTPNPSVGARFNRTDDQRRTERFEERTGFGGARGRAPTFAERQATGERPRPEMFDVICDKCGKHTTVPFRPTNGKPVLCRECFRGQDSNAGNFSTPNNFSDSNQSRSFSERPRQSAEKFADRTERPSRSFDRPRSDDRATFASKPRTAAKQQFEGKRSFGDKGTNQQRYENKSAEANWKGSSAFSQSSIPGVFEFKGNIYTKNANPGQIVYGEKTFTWDGVEYRQWDAMRSKLGAGIKKGMKEIGIAQGSSVLYLGCSTGTTVSHVAEIVGEQGIVYALDVAPRVMRDMTLLAKKRHNIYPLMADANRPTTFAHAVPIVDSIFMDIAQSNQVEIFLKNVHAFLKDGGYALLSLKSRSVDITKTPQQIYAEARKLLEADLIVLDYKTLDPFEKDHALFICKKK